MLEQEITKLTAATTQLTVAIEALLETMRSQSVTPAPEPKPRKAKATKAEEPAIAPASEPEAAPEPKPEPAVVEAPAPAPTGPTLQDIRAAAQKALDNRKVKEIVAINKRYGLKRVSDASPDQYAEILAQLEEINGQA